MRSAALGGVKVRLNKFLTQAGVCARRKADELIVAGRVSVNGRRAVLGESVDPEVDAIAVKGRRVAAPVAAHLTLVVNKPAGIVTTMSDERGRTSVAHLLPKGRRLFPIGRLDANSTGVILCTSDGDLARSLSHPSFGVEKRYRVRTIGELSPESMSALGAFRARRNADGSQSFEMILREGKNRQVRRMCALRGLRVIALERVQFGPIEVGNLAPGKTRLLTAAERAAIDRIRRRAQSGLPRASKVDSKAR